MASTTWHILLLSFFLNLSISFCQPLNDKFVFARPRAATFTTGTPHSSLLGSPAVTPAPRSAFKDRVHPRIVFDKAGWESIVGRIADEKHFDRPGSWASHHRLLTLQFGPKHAFVRDLWNLETSGRTGAYSGAEDLTTMSPARRKSLAPLAKWIRNSTEPLAHSLFLCALWTSVNEAVIMQRGANKAFITETPGFCVTASVGWAKVLLAHRAYCAHGCDEEHGGKFANVWNYTQRFGVAMDIRTCGIGLSLVYDVLYNRMDNTQRKIIRSAIAMLVLKKWSWGNSATSTQLSPNAQIHPHRIFSNWALYHSNLYLSNLAIEGDTEFDAYATAVLAAEKQSGFNEGLNTRFTALIEAYMNHAIYKDGSTPEDWYAYNIAFREGSLGLIAAHRRGLNVLDTDRFRNLIHNAVQMMEPWQCGRLIGHGAGGGATYPGATAFFRYVYPDSPLANLLWRQRMGNNVHNTRECRINYYQDFTVHSILGGEHGLITTADSLEHFEPKFSQHVPLSFYTPRRGLLMARASFKEDAVYVHFDARPDAFIAGHDNADRGGFTYSAYRKTWIDDPNWRYNIGSRYHSLMHVDGLAQYPKAPSVRMLKTEDDGAVVLASADLIRAYNEHWVWSPSETPPRRRIYFYREDGSRWYKDVVLTEKVTGRPTDYDWPDGDDGADLGLTRPEAKMHGDPDFGFAGLWFWKRDYRTELLTHAIRSTILVRVPGEVGYFVVVDSFGVSGDAKNHTFDSYLSLGDNVSVDESASGCSGRSCKIVLTCDGDAQADVHVRTLGDRLSFRKETFKTDKEHLRLVIRSEDMLNEEFWVAFHAHRGEPEKFSMVKAESGDMKITYAGEERFFKVDLATRAAVQTSGATFAPLPQQQPLEFPPVEPRILHYRVAENLEAQDFDTDKSRFVIPSAGTYQAVFRVYSSSNPGRGRTDRFRTCFRYTKATTSVVILDCGDDAEADEKYRHQGCEIVARSRAGDHCRDGKTDMRIALEGEKLYFVILAAERIGDSPIQVRIRHTQGRMRYAAHRMRQTVSRVF